MNKQLHSITTILVAALIFSFFVPLSIGLVYSLHAERARLESQLEKYHEQLLGTLSLSMENALANFEPNEAQNAAKIAIDDPRILGIKVYSSVFEMMLADLTKIPKAGAVRRVKRRYLVKNGEAIGFVEVVINAASYESILHRECINIILLFASMLVCGLLLIIPIIYLKLLRPMGRLMRQAEWLSAGELETPLAWKGQDELSRLGNMLETMRKKLHANFLRIQELAILDELTGLPNRRALNKEADKALDYCRRHGQPLTVALIDIDLFKRINDSLGHAAGDRILQEFAAVVKRSVRKTDICARVGGEEFVLCLPGTDLPEARLVVEKLRTGLSDCSFSYELNVSASIGLTWDSGTANLDTLLQQADQAMYQAKNQGRNRVVVYEPQPEQGDVWKKT